MKKYLIPIILLIFFSILAYSLNVFSFLLIIFIILSLIILILTGIFRIFKAGINRKWFEIPLTVIVICVISILIGLLRPLAPPTISAADLSKTLAYAYKTDQGDRKNLKLYLLINKMRARDSIRLMQVKMLYDEGKISNPLDQFHAAFVFHHGRNSNLFEIAHKLAEKAAAADELLKVYQVQWLAKATYDRWMLSIGNPQKYGTQGKISIGTGSGR